MKTTILEIVLLVLYFPLTIFYLLCGTLLENPQIATAAQWFEFRFCGYVLPVLGLLTFPCLIAAIRLRKKAIKKHHCLQWCQRAEKASSRLPWRGAVSEAD